MFNQKIQINSLFDRKPEFTSWLQYMYVHMMRNNHCVLSAYMQEKDQPSPTEAAGSPEDDSGWTAEDTRQVPWARSFFDPSSSPQKAVSLFWTAFGLQVRLMRAAAARVRRMCTPKKKRMDRVVPEWVLKEYNMRPKAETAQMLVDANFDQDRCSINQG